MQNILSKAKKFKEGTLILIIICICVFLSIVSPSFLTVTNIRAVAISVALDCIVVVGMTLVIVGGGIDLSVGAIMALSCGLTAVLYTSGVPFVICAISGFVASLVCGLINGFLIAKQKMAPFIVTLAMMSIARGVAYILTQGYAISLTGKLPAGFSKMGSGSVGDIPILVLLSIFCIIVADILFRKSPKLRLVFYSGSNEKAALYSGIKVENVKMFVYIFSAALCGLAGILFLARFSYASAQVGSGLEMTLIAGCVIGGASMEGGEGTVLGAALGVIMLALISNGLILLNISVYWQDFISGAILITAVWIDYYRTRKQKQKALVGTKN